MNEQFDPRRAQLSTEALLVLGGPNTAYVKRVVVDGESGYGIHAADGTVLAVLADRDVAFAAARLHDLEPVSAH